MTDFTTYLRSSFLLTVPDKYMYSTGKYLYSAVIEFIKLNMKGIVRILRIG